MADAGVDAGVACTLGSCGATRTCNFTTGACQAASTCTTVNPQPDTCGYAGFCGSTTCAQVKPPTCSNFQQPGSMPSFNPRTNTGPIIYGFVDETIDDASFCGAPGSNIISYSLTLNVYRTDVDWPLATTALPGFFYVKTDGTKVSAVTMMRPSGYRPVGKTATFKVTLCSQATSNVSAGFYFDNGNEMCALAASGMSP